MRHVNDARFEKSAYAIARPDGHRATKSPGMMYYYKLTVAMGLRWGVLDTDVIRLTVILRKSMSVSRTSALGSWPRGRLGVRPSKARRGGAQCRLKKALETHNEGNQVSSNPRTFKWLRFVPSKLSRWPRNDGSHMRLEHPPRTSRPTSSPAFNYWNRESTNCA